MPKGTKKLDLEKEYAKYFVPLRAVDDGPLDLEQPSPNKTVWGITTYGVEDEPVASWFGSEGNA